MLTPAGRFPAADNSDALEGIARTSTEIDLLLLFGTNQDQHGMEDSVGNDITTKLLRDGEVPNRRGTGDMVTKEWADQVFMSPPVADGDVASFGAASPDFPYVGQ